jgi:hypothetical protein
MVTGPVPVEVRITGKVLQLPITTPPKARLVGLAVSRTVGEVMPPEGVRKATICMTHAPDAPRGAVAL